MLNQLKKMESPTKFLIAGIATGAVISVIGYVGLERSKNHVSDLVLQCQAEGRHESEAIEAWRSKNLIAELPPRSGAEAYAQWIVTNKEKKGTPEFEAVAKAYVMLRSGPQTCDFAKLQQLQIESPLTRLQTEILESRHKGESWLDNALTLAGIIALLSAVPYAWYFLLRRIREVREAVAGK